MAMLTNSVMALRDRVAALHDDERGMEAAQVILILVLVVVGLMPILIQIKDKLAAKGQLVSNELDKY